MLAGDAATDLEERGFLRYLLPGVDEYSAQFALVLLTRISREANPVLDWTAAGNVAACPSLPRPPPLQLDLFFCEVVVIDPDSKLLANEKEPLRML